MKVLFFATLKEKAGVTSVDLEIPEAQTVADFKRTIFQQYPQVPQNPSFMLVAINGEYAFDADTIPAGAEIALFPPVSGG